MSTYTTMEYGNLIICIRALRTRSMRKILVGFVLATEDATAHAATNYT
ncbi:hypothetical protein [Arthrobacter alpinus]|nr:hypothetical protein [Arthrobacter alpinus]